MKKHLLFKGFSISVWVVTVLEKSQCLFIFVSFEQQVLRNVFKGKLKKKRKGTWQAT